MASTDPVLVIGDANPDLVLRGDVVPRFGQAEQLLDSAELVIGGSAAITACGLAQLGCPVSLVAVVGSDIFGEFMRDALRDRGVGVEHVRVESEFPTGLTVVLSGPDRAILTRTGAIEALTSADVTRAMVQPYRHLHSSSMFLLPHVRTHLGELFERARQDGASVSLDTNWDPTGEWAGVRELLDFVDLFLPNSAELLAVSTEPDLVSAGRDIAKHGPTVVCKRGADGAVAWAADGAHLDIAGHPVHAIDTTGAGDSFNAGLVSQWLDGSTLRAATEFAVATGALSTTASGGTAAQPTREQVERLLAE